MRPRNTLLILLVLAALGAYVYWVELPEEARKAEEEKLLAVEADRVAGLTLVYPERSIALEKRDGGWHLTEPVAAEADDATVQNLITAVAGAKVTRTLTDVGDKLASYGLAKPVVTVTLRLDDGTSLPPLKVGETTAVGFSTYVQRGDSPDVLITAAAFQSGMKKEVRDLRDKSVMPIDDAAVRKIELARPDGALVIERAGGEEAWEITAPGRYPADAAEIRALLASARGIRATDFATDDPAADLAPYGLATPRLALAIASGDDQTRTTLLIGGAHEDASKKALYAKRGERPTVYVIPEYAQKSLDKDLVTLRDKTVLRYDAAQAARIDVARKDGDGFTLVKRDDAWHVEGGGEGAERGPTITRFVDDLHGFKGSEILAEGTVDLGSFGLDAPDLTITVSNAAGAALGTLVAAHGAPAGPAEEQRSVAAPVGEPVVYGMKTYVLERVDKRAADFREQQPPPTAAPAAPAAPSDAAPPDAPAPTPDAPPAAGE